MPTSIFPIISTIASLSQQLGCYAEYKIKYNNTLLLITNHHQEKLKRNNTTSKIAAHPEIWMFIHLSFSQIDYFWCILTTNEIT